MDLLINESICGIIFPMSVTYKDLIFINTDISNHYKNNGERNKKKSRRKLNLVFVEMLLERD